MAQMFGKLGVPVVPPVFTRVSGGIEDQAKLNTKSDSFSKFSSVLTTRPVCRRVGVRSGASASLGCPTGEESTAAMGVQCLLIDSVTGTRLYMIQRCLPRNLSRAHEVLG